MLSRFERFSFAVSELYRGIHRITTEEMKVYGLKGAHALYLLALYRNGDGITAARVAEYCSRNKADVSRAMAALEKKGLIIREDVGGNHYRALLKLTEEGKRAAMHLDERARLAVDIGGRGISDAERTQLYQMLELIVKNLQELSEDGIPAAEDAPAQE